MYAFLVNLQAFLAHWAETLGPVLDVFLALYLFLPIIYYLIKFKPDIPKTFEFDVDASERSLALVDNHRTAYIIYWLVAGLTMGFRLQARSTSVSSLYLIPLFSLGLTAGMIVIHERSRERLVLYKRRQAKRSPPEITDPKELEESRLLQQLIDSFEKINASKK